MPQPFTQMIGLAGLALFLANFAPDAVNASISALQQQNPSAGVGSVDRSIKTDRAPIRRPGSRPTVASSVEIIGDRQTTVVLRDRSGQVLYRSDALTSTTVVSKNADIPNVNYKDLPPSPTATKWMLGPDHKEGLESRPKRNVPVGCEGVVSPLVNHELRRVPGLCLVMAESDHEAS